MTTWRLQNESNYIVEAYPSPNGVNWRWKATLPPGLEVACGIGMVTEESAKSEAERWLDEQSIQADEWYKA